MKKTLIALSMTLLLTACSDDKENGSGIQPLNTSPVFDIFSIPGERLYECQFTDGRTGSHFVIATQRANNPGSVLVWENERQRNRLSRNKRVRPSRRTVRTNANGEYRVSRVFSLVEDTPRRMVAQTSVALQDDVFSNSGNTTVKLIVRKTANPIRGRLTTTRPNGRKSSVRRFECGNF